MKRKRSMFEEFQDLTISFRPSSPECERCSELHRKIEKLSHQISQSESKIQDLIKQLNLLLEDINNRFNEKGELLSYII